MFILDTDHLGVAQRSAAAEHGFLMQRMRRHPLEDFFVTIVSFHEQVNGWNAYIQRARHEEGLVRGYSMFQAVLADFARMNVLPFDAAAAVVFADLRRSGLRVGAMDLRIAAIALAHGFTVLTRNTVDFARIPGLRIEDWLLPNA